MILNHCVNYEFLEFLISLYGFISLTLGIIIGLIIRNSKQGINIKEKLNNYGGNK